MVQINKGVINTIYVNASTRNPRLIRLEFILLVISFKNIKGRKKHFFYFIFFIALKESLRFGAGLEVVKKIFLDRNFFTTPDVTNCLLSRHEVTNIPDNIIIKTVRHFIQFFK